MEEIEYICRWSTELTPSFKEDFVSVLERVWEKEFNPDAFLCRYVDNIYGPSLLIMAYSNDLPIGTQAFWRNDIDKRVAYQADDGAVMESYRGNGLLGEMIRKGLEILGNDVLLYSYTNNKSKKSFVKLGWDVMSSYPIRPLVLYNHYYHQCPQMADYEYANWYLQKKKHITYVKRNNRYYLIIPTSYRYISLAISCCDKMTAMLFRKKTGFTWLVFNKQPNVIDPEKKGNLVVFGYQGEVIPVWKCDAI